MRNYVIIAIIMLITGLGVGRYLTPSKVTIKEVIVTKEVQVHTTTVITKKADGSSVTTVKDDSLVKEDSKTVDKHTIINASTRNISLLMGLVPNSGLYKPYYGILFTKEIIGPLTGGFFLTNQVSAGITVGMNF